ncbi:uncharacterized protein V6R79_001837 [Siganus canaliculatus]
MNPPEEVQFRHQNSVGISSAVVLNIIWWMVMIAAIGLGATHLSRCPVQPNIPIYLIVLGAASCISLALTYTRTGWDDGCICIVSSACALVLHLFTFGWLIAGTTWIYPVYPPTYVQGGTQYCDKITYQYAFVVTTLVWVLLALMFLCGCCFGLLACCQTVSAAQRFIPNRYSFYGATSEAAQPSTGDV